MPGTNAVDLQGLYDQALQALSKIPGYNQLTAKAIDMIEPVYNKIDEYADLDGLVEKGVAMGAAYLGISMTGPIGLLAAVVLNEVLGDWFAELIGGMFGPNHTQRPEAPKGFHWGSYPIYTGEPIADIDNRTLIFTPREYMLHTVPINKSKPIMLFGQIKEIRTDKMLIHTQTGIPVSSYRKTELEDRGSWTEDHAIQNVVGFTAEGYAILTNPTLYKKYANYSSYGGRAKLNQYTYDYATAHEFMTSNKDTSAAEATGAIAQVQAVAVMFRRQRAAALGGMTVGGLLLWQLIRLVK